MNDLQVGGCSLQKAWSLWYHDDESCWFWALTTSVEVEVDVDRSKERVVKPEQRQLRLNKIKNQIRLV